jgi:PDZ domain-containing protein
VTAADLVVTSETEMDATFHNDSITAKTSVSLPPPPPPSRNVSRRVWWALPLVTLSWLLIVMMLVSSLSFVRFWEIAPGSAESVADRMSFGDDVRNYLQQYETEGDVLFVTALGSRLTALGIFAAWLDDDIEILTFEQRFGTQTPAQRQQANTRAMVSSKQIAEFVALNRLGVPVDFIAGEVIVEEVVCEEGPDPQSACLLLQVDDVVVAFDGEDTPSLDDLIAAVSGREPGELVAVTIRRDGSPEETVLDIRLIEAPDRSGRTIIGIMPRDTRKISTPFSVEIDTDSIGGPSAGLAFTLALLDELSQGSLTGGKRVAATGSISIDELVGPVGAIRQKAVAARASGADIFFVPSDQSEADIAAARRIGGSQMRVETVSSLQDALDVLRSIGGDPLPDSTNSS